MQLNRHEGKQNQLWGNLPRRQKQKGRIVLHQSFDASQIHLTASVWPLCTGKITVLNDNRLGTHYSSFFPYSKPTALLQPGKFVSWCVIFHCKWKFRLDCSFMLFEFICSCFFSLASSRLAGSLLFSCHMKYLAEYREFIKGICTEGRMAAYYGACPVNRVSIRNTCFSVGERGKGSIKP